MTKATIRHLSLSFGIIVPVGAIAPLSRADTPITICSFNIKWLGHYHNKKHEDLAALVGNYDIVVIQEMVAPPKAGNYPDSSPFEADADSQAFLEAMNAHGFKNVLSIEDTGSEIHTDATAPEWFIAFYKDGVVRPADDLPNGFLADDRSENPDYDRVPYAFPFRAVSGNTDFVLISVHLTQGDNPDARLDRQHELASTAAWVDDHDQIEKDFIILGDMNIYSEQELAEATPDAFESLNDECAKTTTSPTNENCFDHVMFRPAYTSTEIDAMYDFKVINLVEQMEESWDDSAGPYPGDPYDGNEFGIMYSDHNPILFRLIDTPTDDDDPLDMLIGPSTDAVDVDRLLARIALIEQQLAALRQEATKLRNDSE
jgi:hypothetical protein